MNKESGFALLMSLIVVGVLISIGLTVLELTITQVKLSTNARDSEIAFNSANAGLECARFWRRSSSDLMEEGQAIAPTCFGVSATANTNSEITTGVTGDGEVFRYDYSFTWGSDGDRCTEVTTLVSSSTAQGAGTTINNMPTLVPGYSESTAFCEAGARCTVLAVRGYNKRCTDVSGFGTVQREVLLQF